jgi:hypothetical protein
MFYWRPPLPLNILNEVKDLSVIAVMVKHIAWLRIRKE